MSSAAGLSDLGGGSAPAEEDAPHSSFWTRYFQAVITHELKSRKKRGRLAAYAGPGTPPKRRAFSRTRWPLRPGPQDCFLAARLVSLNKAALTAAIGAQASCTQAAVADCMLAVGSRHALSTGCAPDPSVTDKLVAFFACVLQHRATRAHPRCTGPKPHGSATRCGCAFRHNALGRALALSAWPACSLGQDNLGRCLELLRQAGAEAVRRALEPVFHGLAHDEARRRQDELSSECSFALLALGARPLDALWLWYDGQFWPAQLDSLTGQSRRHELTVRLRVLEPGDGPGPHSAAGSQALPPADTALLLDALAPSSPSAASGLRDVLASAVQRAGTRYVLRSFRVRPNYDGVPVSAPAAAEWPEHFAQSFEVMELAGAREQPEGRGALCLPAHARQQPFHRFFRQYLDPHLRHVRRDWPVALSVLVGSYCFGGGGIHGKSRPEEGSRPGRVVVSHERPVEH